jgi:hypothetical protein
LHRNKVDKVTGNTEDTLNSGESAS